MSSGLPAAVQFGPEDSLEVGAQPQGPSAVTRTSSPYQHSRRASQLLRIICVTTPFPGLRSPRSARSLEPTPARRTEQCSHTELPENHYREGGQLPGCSPAP